MEENILLDAIERYRNNLMSAEERAYFEELRKNNSDIDQKVVEHTFFLNELNKLSDRKAFKHQLDLIESRLENEGILATKERKTKAKVAYLWNRYRRTIAVAACIAGLVSVSTATLVSNISDKKNDQHITPLVDNKLNQIEHKINQIEHKLNDAGAPIVPVKPKLEANFRATGFLVDGKGYIITNAHVVSKAKNIVVENKKGDQFFATPIYSNVVSDLAILKITDTSFRKVSNLPYTFTRSSAELAEPVYTLGYPREEVVYGEGYLSAKSGFSGDTTSYQISITANPGNSGGPILNQEGEIIGIISSKETNAESVVFAIKSGNIFSALREVKKEVDSTIKLPANNTLKGLSRVQQIKKLEDYIYKIKGN